MLEFVLDLDKRMFLFLNGNNSPFFDGLMWAISGKYIWIPLYLFLVFWLIFRRKMDGVWMILSVIILFGMTDQTSVHFFKNVFERLRPCRDPDLAGMVHIVNGHCGGKFGFISSHAANTFGMATFIALAFRERWLSLSLIIWAAAVSYSRIYLGVHYPFDIICGALWGALLAYGIFWLFLFLNRREGRIRGKPLSL